MDYLDYAPTPTTGHAAPDLAGGFSTIGRWLQLAAVAIEDLCVSAALPRPQDDPRFWHATVAYLVVPELTLDRFRSEPYCTEDGLPGNFRDPLLMRVGHCFAPARLGLVPKGRHGVLEVLRSVSWRTAGVERFIIVATDSLVDVSSLRWLDESGRLKSDLNPVGLSPGEASVALMLEEPRIARNRGARASAILHAVATDLDPERGAGNGAGGIGLARATTEVLERTSLHEHGAACFVADLNGEPWRARELAYAQQRVGHERWNSDRMMLPAMSTGDPGAAMPALQVLVATKALQRQYAGGSSVLISSSDPGGRVGAAIIGRG